MCPEATYHITSTPPPTKSNLHTSPEVSYCIASASRLINRALNASLEGWDCTPLASPPIKAKRYESSC